VYVEKYQKMYPDHEIVLTGHSLGGTLAENIAIIKPGIQCETFNTGNSPINTLANLMFGGCFKNIK